MKLLGTCLLSVVALGVFGMTPVTSATVCAATGGTSGDAHECIFEFGPCSSGSQCLDICDFGDGTGACFWNGCSYAFRTQCTSQHRCICYCADDWMETVTTEENAIKSGGSTKGLRPGWTTYDGGMTLERTGIKGQD